MIIKNPAKQEISGLRALWKEAFGDSDPWLDLFFGTAFSPDRCLCVTEGEIVVSAVYWFRCTCQSRSIAYVYALATAKDFRGLGIARKLMDALHAHLQAQGYAGTLLVPGEEGLFALYGSMGYRTCTQIQDFVCTGAADEVQLRRIGVEEYAQQRRELLSYLEKAPVLQEQENLRLLETQAVFYAGQNFLLAARREGDTLVGLELLGDAQTAPGILQTLGCAQGQFRTRGSGRDFAMFRSLAADFDTLPTYFGLAFD